MDKFWDANGAFANHLKPESTLQEVQRFAVPLIAALRKTPLSGLLSEGSETDILECLDPAVHSLSYLFVL